MDVSSIRLECVKALLQSRPDLSPDEVAEAARVLTNAIYPPSDQSGSRKDNQRTGR